MPSVLLPIQIGTIVDTCWPNTPQELLVRFADVMQAVLDGGQGFFNYGSTKPAPELQVYPWFRTTDHRWYEFSGDWIASNPEPTTSIVRRFVRGDAAAIATYDGGDTDPASDRSGPMWEIDPDMVGRLAISAGAIPGRTLTPTTLNVDDTAGAGEGTITTAQMPPHVHTVDLKDDIAGTGEDFAEHEAAPAGSTADTTMETGSTGGSGTPAATQPFSILPPVMAGNWVRRTSRIYYKVP